MNVPEGIYECWVKGHKWKWWSGVHWAGYACKNCGTPKSTGR